MAFRTFASRPRSENFVIRSVGCGPIHGPCIKGTMARGLGAVCAIPDRASVTAISGNSVNALHPRSCNLHPLNDIVLDEARKAADMQNAARCVQDTRAASPRPFAQPRSRPMPSVTIDRASVQYRFPDYQTYRRVADRGDQGEGSLGAIRQQGRFLFSTGRSNGYMPRCSIPGASLSVSAPRGTRLGAQAVRFHAAVRSAKTLPAT